MQGSGQRFTARDDWRVSAVTREMSALAVLGFAITVEPAYDDLTGRGWTLFHHSPMSLDPQRAALPRAKSLIQGYRSGQLEQGDALHPLLDALRAMANFDALEAWRLQGQSCCLAADAVPLNQPPEAAQRARLVPGVPPQAKGKGKAQEVLVGNAANAAALALVGVPVLRLVEREGATAYALAAESCLRSEGPRIKTSELLTQARAGQLAKDHPFLLGREAVVALVKMLKILKAAEEHTMIHWRNRQDNRSASLLSSASDRARDLAWKHMK